MQLDILCRSLQLSDHRSGVFVWKSFPMLFAEASVWLNLAKAGAIVALDYMVILIY